MPPEVCPDLTQRPFSLSFPFISGALNAPEARVLSEAPALRLAPTRAAVPASSFSFSRFSSSAEVGPLGLCTANTPLRDSSFVAKAALESLAPGPILAAAAAVPAVSGTGAESAAKDDDDDNAAASAEAMLL